MIGEFISAHSKEVATIIGVMLIALSIWLGYKCNMKIYRNLKKRTRKEWEQERRENEAFRASIKRDKPTYEEWLAQREKEKKD